MTKLDTSYHERSHYRSYFLSTWLHVLSHIFFLMLFIGILFPFFMTLLYNSPVLHVPFIIWCITGVLLFVLYLFWVYRGGYSYWSMGIFNPRLSQKRVGVFTTVCSISAVLSYGCMLPFFLTILYDPMIRLGIQDWVYWAALVCSSCSLGSFAILAGVQIVLNTHRAIWRNIWRAIRHDKIQSDFSPTSDLSHWVNRIQRWRRRHISISNFYLLLIIALVLGGLVLPIIRVGAREDFATFPLRMPATLPTSMPATLPTSMPATLPTSMPTALPTSTAPATPPSQATSQTIANLFIDLDHLFETFYPTGLLHSVVIFGLLLAASTFFRRQRYIFTPFTVVIDSATQEAQKSTKEPAENTSNTTEQLQSAALHLTQQFIDQLEHIGFLLTTRQVERVQGERQLPIADFITSGGEDEFLAAIQSLVDIDERAKNIPGKLLAALTKIFAVITISGSLRRRDATTLELEVRLTQRLGNQTSIIVPITSLYSTDDSLDDQTATKTARTAALRLLIRAGAVSHLASSEASLSSFLDGLAASANKNWWRAAEAYQDAIQREEAIHGSFGIGRYHLGVSQIQQGEFAAGKANLEQAERSGKPIAEVYYMLALLLLHTYWEHLDDNGYEAQFRQIVRYAQRALVLRRSFPEAYHLLGAAHYHRGKLFDRADTQPREEHDTPEPQFFMPNAARIEYDRAMGYLRKALRQYDGRIFLLQTEVASNLILQGELERLRRDRMSATHHLADACRSGGFYPLAETYYRDFLAAYPSNVRTMIDLTKTYLLAANWQRADQYLSREVLIFPECKWDADINMHVGWAYAGGANELLAMTPFQGWYLWLLKQASMLLRKMVGLPKKVLYVPQSEGMLVSFADPEPYVLLGRAMSHLDYALHQRSGFIVGWRQTAWRSQLYQACTWYHRVHAAPTSTAQPAETAGESRAPQPDVAPSNTKQPAEAAAQPDAASLSFTRMIMRAFQKGKKLDAGLRRKPKDITDDQRTYVMHLEQWLQLRIDQMTMGELPAERAVTLPHGPFSIYYKEFKYHHARIIELQQDIDRTGRLHGVFHSSARLELAVLALDNWKLATFFCFGDRDYASQSGLPFYEPQAHILDPSFAHRWFYDVYAEICLLTARLLAEAEAYEIAWIVAAWGAQLVHLWIERWNMVFETTVPGFKFSPYVGRYQLATLLSWKAYCADRLEQDTKAKARLLAGKQRFIGIQQQLLSQQMLDAITTALTSEVKASPTQERAASSLVQKLDALRRMVTVLNTRQAIVRARSLLAEAHTSLEGDIAMALTQMPRHPLALWVKAQQARYQSLPEQAVDILQRLREIIAPFDPNKQIATWHILEKRYPASESTSDVNALPHPSHSPKYRRAQISRHSLVNGRKQFWQIVNPYTIHEQIAAVFADTGRYDLSVQHLMQALTLSTYWDVDTEHLLLRLLQQLDRMEYLRDAYAVVGALRASRQIFEHNARSIVHGFIPDMWECIILTRLKRFGDSLVAGRRLQQRINEFIGQSDQLPMVYERRLLHVLSPAWKDRLSSLWQRERNTELTWLEPSAAPGQQNSSFLRLQEQDGVLSQYLGWYKELRHFLHALQSDGQDDLPKATGHIGDLDFTVVPSHHEAISLHHHEVAMMGLPRLNIDRNLSLSLLDFLADEAIGIRELQAQLLNNMAYNLIELRFQQGTTRASMLPLKTDENPREMIKQAIHLLLWLDKNQLVRTSQRHRLDRELAFYYDTKGWLYYRLAHTVRGVEKADYLHKAKAFFHTALSYDQKSAIIYYHAARVNLLLLEVMWEQKRFAVQGTTADQQEQTSPNDYLSMVHHYWTQARFHDYSGRFRSQLAWVGLKLVEYRAIWKERQIHQ